MLQALRQVSAAAEKAEAAKTAAADKATRQRERIALNARDLEVRYGRQVADAYLARLDQMRAAGEKLTLTRINETKRWAELEVAEYRRTVAEARTAAAEKAKAARAAQAEYRAMAAQVQETTLRRMELERTATVRALQGERDRQTAIQRTMAEELSRTRGTLAMLSTASTTAASRWKTAGESITKYGTTATELGHTLMTSVVAPLAAAGAGLTDWGLKAADVFQNTQTSLRNMGMALRDADALMNNLTRYGLQTPYAVGDMLTYGTRIARAAGAHNSDFNSADPRRQARGSTAVSTEAQHIVQMIGDLAARGGITDSAMVQRGYYAIEKLMDADRVSLRDTKQLEYAINMPVQDLAQLLGFRDSQYTQRQVDGFKKVNPGFHAKAGDIYPASAMMMEVMANAKDTGGVRGQDLVGNLLEFWEGKKALPGGKPDKTIRGAAERLGTATFSSRISNMKETWQQQLRAMFQT
ncbi:MULTISPECIES: hypothetical protein [Streptomycetaceae]|uniref:Uncharacterized protein n=1 Tax=Streptantibioticus cattleyicolor (strain ATCC 35852 / DSM 46488 / JCM 4925 / NBRC 14057 / NRRL 8057) TaxID=1003195 RepID=F8JPY9_STREN|nr:MULTISPECIES: hypothetical protein [Streptomycetaceae]AEW94048.1 hypothetical protein SCATT_16770 [Streptantibioticus cattleyicolor NRRL 8057 = DSM 46488]MYS58721.1 hypothetical protein [Streptomyces sp. SID5468]CCB74400.1 protein of unknown function [Streptantibioticus cattleyicolor NRRL 8057 = DSM 46488]